MGNVRHFLPELLLLTIGIKGIRENLPMDAIMRITRILCLVVDGAEKHP
jgi:hypothetical protein